MDLFTEFKHRNRSFGSIRKKRTPFNSIVHESIVLDRHISLHATKGWRNESLKRVLARKQMALKAEAIAMARAARNAT